MKELIFLIFTSIAIFLFFVWICESFIKRRQKKEQSEKNKAYDFDHKLFEAINKEKFGDLL